MKEEKMMARIRDAEKSQSLAELTQKISSLEYKNQELVTEGEVSKVGNDEDQVPKLQDKVAELKAEMARLMAINRRLLSQSNQRLDFASGPESDFEDAEDLRLKLDVNDYIHRRDSAGGPSLEDLRHHRIRSSSMGSGNLYKSYLSDENGRERKPSTQSDGGSSPLEGKISPPVFVKSVQRRTSQSMEDAFLEQLPEVKPKIQCNGSTSDEGS
ncbi:Ecotropic viral integration site 5 [Armadillidium vulgare]|nr:Ecotropic viral integration site 5 [Armadillidium vulgare]